MRKRGLILFIVALLLSLTLSGLALGAEEQHLERIGGENRYETAAQAALQAFPDGADTVVLARGDLIVDGLAASFLAGQQDAPILLTQHDELNPETKQAIEDLGAKKVFLVGGTVALSEEVKASLEAKGLEVERIAGANRIETALSVAARAGDAFERIYLVNGWAFADALVASPSAYEEGIPIVVDQGQSVSSTVGQALQKWGVKEVTIIGGTDVVTSNYAKELETLGFKVVRKSGANRYETALAFAQDEYGEQVKGISIVNGNDRHLVDALGAAAYGEPVLYIRDKDPATSNEPVLNYVKELLTHNKALTVTLFGGKTALSQEVEEQFKDAVQDALAVKVKGVQVIDRNTIEVTFDEEIHAVQAGDIQLKVTGPRGYEATASGTVQEGDTTASFTLSEQMAWQGYYTLQEISFFVGDGQLIKGSFEHAGYERTYEVYIPSSYDGSRPVPLLLSFHGMGGAGAGQINSSGYTDIAEKEGFIAVFPDSTRLTEAGDYAQYIPKIPIEIAGVQWDPAIGIALQYYYEVDDVGFIDRLIDKLLDEYNIDPDRIYATGHSSGGMFVYNLAMHLSHKLAAVAAVSSPMTMGLKDKEPAQPITIIQVMGNEDEIIPFTGGPDKVFGALPGQDVWFSFYDSGAFWAEKNGIQSEPTVTTIGEKVVKTTYSGGKNGTEVILYEIKGGGHGWPDEEEINSEAIWEELANFSRVAQ